MGQIVLITKQCYILCEAVNYITMCPELDEEDLSAFFRPSKKNKRNSKSSKRYIISTMTEKERNNNMIYNITVKYVPVAIGTVPIQSGRAMHCEDVDTVSIRVVGYERGIALFEDMMRQIRMQMPDHLFLDKIVSDFLSTEIKA